MKSFVKSTTALLASALILQSVPITMVHASDYAADPGASLSVPEDLLLSGPDILHTLAGYARDLYENSDEAVQSERTARAALACANARSDSLSQKETQQLVAVISRIRLKSPSFPLFEPGKTLDEASLNLLMQRQASWKTERTSDEALPAQPIPSSSVLDELDQTDLEIPAQDSRKDPKASLQASSLQASSAASSSFSEFSLQEEPSSESLSSSEKKSPVVLPDSSASVPVSFEDFEEDPVTVPGESPEPEFDDFSEEAALIGPNPPLPLPGLQSVPLAFADKAASVLLNTPSSIPAAASAVLNAARTALAPVSAVLNQEFASDFQEEEEEFDFDSSFTELASLESSDLSSSEFSASSTVLSSAAAIVEEAVRSIASSVSSNRSSASSDQSFFSFFDSSQASAETSASSAASSGSNSLSTDSFQSMESLSSDSLASKKEDEDKNGSSEEPSKTLPDDSLKAPGIIEQLLPSDIQDILDESFDFLYPKPLQDSSKNPDGDGWNDFDSFPVVDISSDVLDFSEAQSAVSSILPAFSSGADANPASSSGLLSSLNTPALSSPALSAPAASLAAPFVESNPVVSSPHSITVRKLNTTVNRKLKVKNLGIINLLPDFSNSSAWKQSSSPYNTPYLWGQCTWFAWARFYELYGYSPEFHGNGYDCVGQLLSAHPDKFRLSSVPAAGSVFSSDVAHNHVGIVLDYDEEKDILTIQEGNLDGVSNFNWEEAIQDYRTIRLSSRDMRALYGKVTYAVPKTETRFSEAQSAPAQKQRLSFRSLRSLAFERLREKVFIFDRSDKNRSEKTAPNVNEPEEMASE